MSNAWQYRRELCKLEKAPASLFVESGPVLDRTRSRPNMPTLTSTSTMHVADQIPLLSGSDVNNACHAHSVYGKAWSAFGREVRMLNQGASTFYKMHTVYANFGGLVLEDKVRERLATRLHDKKAIILQNHGISTVSETIEEAAFLFTLLERTYEVQLKVEITCKSGLEKKIIGDEEASFS